MRAVAPKSERQNVNLGRRLSSSELLESTNSTPNILRDDCNDKLPLITESVTVTQIDIHPVGEEPDQHIIRLTPGGSHV
jgi:hypothetical protein